MANKNVERFNVDYLLCFAQKCHICQTRCSTEVRRIVSGVQEVVSQDALKPKVRHSWKINGLGASNVAAYTRKFSPLRSPTERVAGIKVVSVG